MQDEHTNESLRYLHVRMKAIEHEHQEIIKDCKYTIKLLGVIMVILIFNTLIAMLL